MLSKVKEPDNYWKLEILQHYLGKFSISTALTNHMKSQYQLYKNARLVWYLIKYLIVQLNIEEKFAAFKKPG